MQNATRVDHLDIYGQQMLADSAELSLLRFKRTKLLGDADRQRVWRLLELFNEALEADRAISGSQMASSTDRSVTVLRMVTQVLLDMAEFRSALENLRLVAEEVVNGTIPSDSDLDSLIRFIHSYGLYQKGRLTKSLTAAPTAGDQWPPQMRLTSS